MSKNFQPNPAMLRADLPHAGEHCAKIPFYLQGSSTEDDMRLAVTKLLSLVNGRSADLNELDAIETLIIVVDVLVGMLPDKVTDDIFGLLSDALTEARLSKLLALAKGQAPELTEVSAGEILATIVDLLGDRGLITPEKVNGLRECCIL